MQKSENSFVGSGEFEEEKTTNRSLSIPTMQSSGYNGSEDGEIEESRGLKKRKYGLKGKSVEREETATLKKSRFSRIENVVFIMSQTKENIKYNEKKSQKEKILKNELIAQKSTISNYFRQKFTAIIAM